MVDGLLARCLVITGAQVKTEADAAGPAVVATVAKGDPSYTAQVWGVHGLYSMPPDDTMGIRVPVGSERFGVVMATHHYKTPRPTLAKGEVALMATDAAGTTAGGKVVARADGTLEINGTGKRLMTDDMIGIFATFITALNASLVAAGGSAVSLDLTPAKTTTVKTGG